VSTAPPQIPARVNSQHALCHICLGCIALHTAPPLWQPQAKMHFHQWSVLLWEWQHRSKAAYDAKNYVNSELCAEFDRVYSRAATMWYECQDLASVSIHPQQSRHHLPVCQSS